LPEAHRVVRARVAGPGRHAPEANDGDGGDALRRLDDEGRHLASRLPADRRRGTADELFGVGGDRRRARGGRRPLAWRRVSLTILIVALVLLVAFGAVVVVMRRP